MIKRTVSMLLVALLVVALASPAYALRISGFDALGEGAAVGDLYVVVDVSDTTMAATGTTKKQTASNLFAGATDLDAGGALSADVVAANEMDDADHGMGSWLTGALTIEDFALNADADAGDFDILSLDKLEGLDAQIYIDLGTNGYIDLEADTGIRFNGPMIFANEGELNLPSTDATPDTAGELRHDITVTGLATGSLVWWDGDEARYLVDLEVLPVNDAEVITYSAANDNFVMSAAGSGDVTDVFACSTGDCAVITMTDNTDLLNMSGISVTSTSEGLILPGHATDCSSAGTAEGQVCWEADANTLYIGNDGGVTAITSGSATAWDDIGDSGSDETIALVGFETIFTSTIDEAGGVVLAIDNTDADGLTNDTHLLELQHSNDGDAEGEFLLITDNDADVKLEIVEEGKIVMTPGDTTTASAITITPSAAMANAEDNWMGLYINGAALDPSAVEVDIHGIHIDLSGVDTTNDPHLDGLIIDMPTNVDHAIAVNGTYVATIDASAFAPGMSGTVFNATIDVTGSTGGHGHVVEGTMVGHDLGNTATGAMLGTYGDFPVIHQHTGTWATPDQEGADSYCGVADASDGDNYADGLDGITVFVADDDQIWVGAAAEFSALEVICSTNPAKTIIPTFHYMNGSSAWVQFYPTDATGGFTVDSTITWDADEFTDWGATEDPAAGEGEAGYWMKVTRTRANNQTVAITTLKTLAATEYTWNGEGDLLVDDISANLIIADSSDVLAIGDNSETIAIDSSDWNIGATGIATGLGNITSDGELVVVGVDASGTVSGNLFTPDAHDDADIGTVDLHFSDLYLADSSIIYGQDDQSNTLTSSATGWTANLNLAAATYGSDGSISDAELLTLDDGATTEILVGGGAGSAPVWTTAEGTGEPVRDNSPDLITPNIGAAVSDSLDNSDGAITNVADIALDSISADTDNGVIAVGDGADLPHVQLDGTPAADDTYTGTTINSVNCGEAVAQWDLVYMDGTTAEWMLADATTGTNEWPAIGMAVAACTDGNPGIILVQGVVRNAGWSWSDQGVVLYLDETTSGSMTETAPSTPGDCVQHVARVLAITDDVIFFNPNTLWVEID